MNRSSVADEPFEEFFSHFSPAPKKCEGHRALECERLVVGSTVEVFKVFSQDRFQQRHPQYLALQLLHCFSMAVSETTNERQPTTDSQRPTSDQQPTTDNRQPTTTNNQPTTNQQPTTNNHNNTRFMQVAQFWGGLFLCLNTPSEPFECGVSNGYASSCVMNG